jgi:6-phosphogluconate dehydrogenase
MGLRLGIGNEEIGKVFVSWNEKGELSGTFLVQIGIEICERRKTRVGDGKGEGIGKDGFVLDEVLDKVVQDDDDTEGTGYWSVMEAADRHVSAPTIAATQFMHVASGNRVQRVKVVKKLRMPEPKTIDAAGDEKDKIVEDLRCAVYAATLASFCEDLELIARTSKDEGWNVNLATRIRIWRAGHIIQCDHIVDMLEPIFASNSKSAPHPTIMNIK